MRKKIISIIVIGLIIFSIFISKIPYNDEVEIIKEYNLRNSDLLELSPIVIDDTGSGDYTWTQAVAQSWCSGAGSWSNPYIISNISIDGASSGSSLEIRSSTAYFIIQKSVFYGAGLALEDCAGIKLVNTNNGRIIDNDCSDNNRHGIYLLNSNNNTVFNNTARYNYWCGIALENSDDNTIDSNILEENDDGLEFYNHCDYNKLINNKVLNNDQYGIYIRSYSSYNTIEANTIRDNQDAIYFHYYSVGAEIYDNVIEDNTGTAIYLNYHCNNHIIINNTVQNNNAYGVYLYAGCEWTSIRNNSFIGNSHGVYMRTNVNHYSDNNEIIENVFSLNSYGIRTYWVDNNVIFRNNFTYNINYGVYISSWSYDNNITENNFIENGINGYDTGINSTWNNTLRGNYWSDFSGRDQNEDGIGDQPYNVTGDVARDHLPIWDDGIEAPPYFISNPSSFQMVEGDPYKNITWTPLDENKNYDTYWILRNDTKIAEGNWDGSQIIYMELNSLDSGSYAFECFVNDTDNEIVSSSVIIEVLYDDVQPIITILNPIASSVYGTMEAPSFEIAIEEFNLNSTWYSLNNVNYSITMLSGVLDYDEWNNCGNGTHTIQFYANDSNGNTGMNLVEVVKDTYSPQITIHNPKVNMVFGHLAPFFNISIIEPHLQTSYYSLNGGSPTLFSGNSGMINQGAWDACSNGTVVITFELWDQVENIGTESVTIKKDIEPPIMIINEPNPQSLYSNTPPNFQIDIIEGNLNETWYTLNSGASYGFVGTSGAITQEAWDTCGNGSVVIRFYARDIMNETTFSDVLVFKDILSPEITLFDPISSEVFGITPPNFNITIEDSNLNIAWYTLNDGNPYYFTENYGIINSSAWNLCSDGIVAIKFYANDSVGNLNLVPVDVIKDSDLPEIEIHSPAPLQLCGLNSPYFNISLIDNDLDTTWYSLNDGNTLIFSGTTGTIYQPAWDLCGNGTVKITFYANNSLGHVASSESTVRKETRCPDITVFSPIVSEIFGNTSFRYEIDIDEPYIDSIWYTLNDDSPTYISSFIGMISQTAWDLCGNGTVSLKFYANNTAANVGSTEILINKDTHFPSIVIISPVDLSIYSYNSPNFELFIDDPDLDSIWYNINGSSNFYTTLTGKIDQILWDTLANDSVTIQFYANNTAGNIVNEEVLIYKDIIPPEIIINFPLYLNLYANDSPSFGLIINEGNLNETWYTLNNGSNNYFTGTTGKINQTAWDLCENGTISMRFYAKDFVSQISYIDVLVLKDISAPIINISEPLSSIVFGLISPNYNISIQEGNLDKIWYRLNGGNIYHISEYSGEIDQTEWDLLSDGLNSIIFYANDTLGNIGFTEITFNKDSLLPEITIISPYPMQINGFIAPNFQISIFDVDLNSSWYTLNHGAINMFSGTTGPISQNNWDLYANGTVLITFYANNSLGHIVYSEVIVQKDIICPQITVISPIPSEVFGNETFQYEIYVEEPSIDSIWYSLNNGENHTITELSGTILQSAWDFCTHGSIILKFYANDSLGNLGYSEIIIFKDTLCPVITINIPEPYELYGIEALQYNISVEEPHLDRLWYTLNNGLPFLFNQLLGTLDQTYWDACGNGTVNLMFYANDTFGNTASSQIVVRKDIYYPFIEIISPTPNQICGIFAPSYNIDVSTMALDTLWFTINDSTNYVLASTEGVFNQSIWEGYGADFDLEIKFWANDTYGQINYQSVLIRKESILINRNAYAIIVGVSNYPGTSSDLMYCRSDAITMNTMLRSQYNFKPENMIMLTDSSASFSGIINAFSTIRNKMTSNDIFVFYFSGHGGESSSSLQFICPYDSIPFNPAKLIYDSALNSLINQLPCDDKIVIIDACNSGGFIPEVQSSNRFIMTACKGDQLSWETSELRHGVFSYFFFDSIFAATDSNSDGVLSLEEQFAYASSESTSYMLGYGELQQPQKYDGISGQCILFPSIGSLTLTPIGNELHYSFYVYGHGLIYCLNITASSILAGTSVKRVDLKYDSTSYSGFGYYSGILQLEAGYNVSSYEFRAEIQGYSLKSFVVAYGDSDNDGLYDFIEILNGMNPSLNDTDSDGLSDYDEFIVHNTNPISSDTDSDGLTDYEEIIIYNTNPLHSDTDSDTMPDKWEVDFSLNPLVNDTMLDPDIDGLVNIIEYQNNTNPQNPDSDSDGLNDGDEINIYFTNPVNNDTDSDNLLDSEEIFEYHTDPLNNDTDDDGLSDFDEIVGYLTNPLTNDTDSDNFTDYDEIFIYNTNPLSSDTDEDGLTDYEEIIIYGTNSTNADTDSDTIPDGWEVNFALDPFTNDTGLDPDNDLLLNLDEFLHNSDPHNNDTDSDQLFDGEEVFTYYTDPTNEDTDSDDLLDNEEVLTYNTDPLNDDSDSDELLDGEEVLVHGTNPLSSDSDLDTMPDKWEVDYLLDPLVNDTALDPDTDGLSNIEEYQCNTDPQDSDTDNDSWDDGTEVDRGTDPLDPDDHPNPPPPPGIPGYDYILLITLVIVISSVIIKKKELIRKLS